MKKLFAAVGVGAVLLLSAWTRYSATWGVHTVYLPDGAVCVPLTDTDGGFNDAGFADGGFVDGGFVTYDGGVCADGGTGVDCTACSGTCAADGGSIDGGPVDGGPQDGGWAPGTSVPVTSDPLFATTELAVACYVSNPPLSSSSSNVTVQLVGTADKNPQTGVYAPYSNTSQSCAASDGGSCALPWIQGAPALMPYSEIQETANNSDGGLMCCPVSAY